MLHKDEQKTNLWHNMLRFEEIYAKYYAGNSYIYDIIFLDVFIYKFLLDAGSSAEQ